ncbi:MAG: mannose-1-phosphate guanylyltransferase [Acidimicrobiia bacterium]
MTPTIRPVILSGGAGTRLWPLSTRDSPKQFLDLLGEPQFEATLGRVRGLPGAGPVIVVTGGEHVGAVEAALANFSVDLAALLIEPSGRNTAPALVAAALVSGPDDVLLVLPSDHLIADSPAFGLAMAKAVDLALEGSLVTFGIEPSRPETGYGYIEKGHPVDGGFRVARFKEKPDADEAVRLLAGGDHLWNSGMFVFVAGRVLDEAVRLVPEIVDGVRGALPPGRTGKLWLEDGFSHVPSISIDHAIMERTERAVVIPLDAGWSDVGSWQSVWELSDRDDDGNAMIGDVLALDVADSYVRSGSRTIAIAGVEGLVVVETPEVVLIVPREKGEMVRDLAARWETRRRVD